MNKANTVEITQKFLKFLTERNLDELAALFSENVDWYIPGDESKADWLGQRSSREDVREFYEMLWSATQPVSASIDNILIDDETAVIVGEFSTRMLSTNNVVESLFSIQLRVRDNQITRYRLLEDSFAVSQALTH